MGVRLQIACDGCDATAQDTPRLRRRFVGMFGGDSGFGRGEWPDPESLAPEGWVLSDPWTYCTYCPECWAHIDALGKAGR